LIARTFECGVPTESEVCKITLDFKLDQIAATDETAVAGVSIMVWIVLLCTVTTGQVKNYAEVARMCGVSTARASQVVGAFIEYKR
jgi:hypothetical protein